ncbi:molecular chaperone [Aeromonas sanarellii]|uniref:fimbrial biogenesis chaperone n=1 Tax=Aeromonas sanarellii TaxID=633415 RepID=UPI0039A17F2F
MILVVGGANASIVIHGTRVIYNGDKKEATISITNKNKTPVLIQSWVDSGGGNSQVNEKDIPFIITPPINRVNPDNGQTLRIRYTGNPKLPSDKESVFWLNVLEIPAKTEGVSSQQNVLSLAFRSKIKIFYRPQGLSGEAASAADNLKWSMESNGIRVTNPTQYHVSIVNVFANKKSGSAHDIPGRMIAPGETQFYDLKTNNIGLDEVGFSTINDYGALMQHKIRK